MTMYWNTELLIVSSRGRNLSSSLCILLKEIVRRICVLISGKNTPWERISLQYIKIRVSWKIEQMEKYFKNISLEVEFDMDRFVCEFLHIKISRDLIKRNYVR